MRSSQIDFENLPIYIIHCSKNQERKDIVLSQLEKLGSKNINIFDAITPETLQNYSDYEQYHDMFDLPENDKRCVCGTISHRVIHTLAQEKNYKYFLTLEDDFKVLDHFEQWKKKVKEKDFEFDILSMGGFYDKFDEEWITDIGDKEIYGIKKVNCSVAILYTEKASQKFVDLFNEKFCKKHFAIDGFMGEFVYRSLKSRALYPNPISVYPTVSTINLGYIDHENFYKELNDNI
jgi:GR25 family glycosyltransferase involved in LPS biosynthesis